MFLAFTAVALFATNAVVTPSEASGGKCGFDSDCGGFGKCKGGTCGHCGFNSDCKVGKCGGGRCGACSFDSDCKGGKCSGGRCLNSP
jgi:hypothetical protein